MNSRKYFDFIEERLNTLSVRISSRAALNLQDINISAEYFFRDLLNMMYGWNLLNLNDIQKNAPGIDLLYKEKNIIVQVSATNTKQKVQHSLDEINTQEYNGYTFKFLLVTKDAKKLRTYKYNIPNGITFNPSEDIIDVPQLLKDIYSKEIDQLNDLYEFIKKHLSSEPQSVSRIKGINRIIQILSQDGVLNESNKFDTSVFEIEEKIRSNNLEDIASKIEDFSIFLGDVQKVYETYDKEGVNKSRAVLNALNNIYLKLKKDYDGFNLMEEIENHIYKNLSGEESLSEFCEEDLRYYIEIILVDAFSRCKIFENPKKIRYGAT